MFVPNRARFLFVVALEVVEVVELVIVQVQILVVVVLMMVEK